jgi:hypothetical protein
MSIYAIDENYDPMKEADALSVIYGMGTLAIIAGITTENIGVAGTGLLLIMLGSCGSEPFRMELKG